jgi:hypothetical protein
MRTEKMIEENFDLAAPSIPKILFRCTVSTLGSDRHFSGRILDFDMHEALVTLDSAATCGFVVGKTIVAVNVLSPKPLHFLAQCKELRLDKSEELASGVMVLKVLQVPTETEEVLMPGRVH